MMPLIGILDYGLGNVNAFINSCKDIGLDTRLIRDPSEFSGVSHIILPGVGRFDVAMAKLRASGLLSDLISRVNDGWPLLGVCVGAQMLLDYSEEGECEGLGLIPGNVRKLAGCNSQFRVPHVGWNANIGVSDHSSVWTREFYFLHSYYCDLDESSDCRSVVIYGDQFTTGFERGAILGSQFHPEKSHGSGLMFLKFFSEK